MEAASAHFEPCAERRALSASATHKVSCTAELLIRRQTAGNTADFWPSLLKALLKALHSLKQEGREFGLGAHTETFSCQACGLYFCLEEEVVGLEERKMTRSGFRNVHALAGVLRQVEFITVNRKPFDKVWGIRGRPLAPHFSEKWFIA